MSVEVLHLWIDGRRVQASGDCMAEAVNPATGRVIHRLPLAAFPVWRASIPLRCARSSPVSANCWSTTATNWRGSPARSTARRSPTPPARCSAVVEFASGVPQLLKGEQAEDMGRGVDCHSILHRWGCAPVSRRSTYRSWSRCGCFRWPSHAATPSRSSFPKKCHPAVCAWPNCSSKPACAGRAHRRQPVMPTLVSRLQQSFSACIQRLACSRLPDPVPRFSKINRQFHFQVARVLVRQRVV